MLQRTLLARARLAVAHFNMKHFRGKHKAPLTPQNIKSTFTSLLDPQDRLLRQSKVGAGSTRVLVLDRHQKVKGVYSPVLCLPHPSVVPGGDSSLGITIDEYLRALEPTMPEKAASASSKKAHPIFPTVLTVLSHPNGIAVGSFTGNGVRGMPLQNFSSMSITGTGLGAVAEDMASKASVDVINALVDSINAAYDTYLSRCSTFYFVVKDSSVSLSLITLQNVIAKNANDDAFKCKVAFDDKRWVTVPDTVLQVSKDTTLPPLYTRDSQQQKVVSQAGLLPAVASGMLELDFAPRMDGAPAPPAF